MGRRGPLVQREVQPNWSSGKPFSVDIAANFVGLLTDIEFRLEGTSVTSSTLDDDAPWGLISDLSIILPLKIGDVTIQTTGVDLSILCKYLTGKVRENTTSATAGAFFALLRLPLGPRGHGYHSAAFRENSFIQVKGTWGPPTGYGASTTDITTGRLVPSLIIDEDAAPRSDRVAFAFTTKQLDASTAARKEGEPLNKPARSVGLVAVMYRTYDASAAAHRVDGLVRRLALTHGQRGMLHDAFFADLRQAGVEWSGLSEAQVAAASPLGFDGTALYVASPDLVHFPDIKNAALNLMYDTQISNPVGTSAVTPATGDALFATVLGVIAPGM